uniref:Uncharacterized protein n=1 Tax=Anopheles albimanus TaxID=7167 RepID=A0A182FEF3_ANOAL
MASSAPPTPMVTGVRRRRSAEEVGTDEMESAAAVPAGVAVGGDQAEPMDHQTLSDSDHEMQQREKEVKRAGSLQLLLLAGVDEIDKALLTSDLHEATTVVEVMQVEATEEEPRAVDMLRKHQHHDESQCDKLAETGSEGQPVSPPSSSSSATDPIHGIVFGAAVISSSQPETVSCGDNLIVPEHQQQQHQQQPMFAMTNDPLNDCERRRRRRGCLEAISASDAEPVAAAAAAAADAAQREQEDEEPSGTQRYRSHPMPTDLSTDADASEDASQRRQSVLDTSRHSWHVEKETQM